MLPLATSIDGRTFSFEASLYELEFRVGGYVMLTNGSQAWLGQVLTLELGYVDDYGDAPDGPRRVTTALGTGTVLVAARSFHHAVVRRATPA